MRRFYHSTPSNSPQTKAGRPDDGVMVAILE